VRILVVGAGAIGGYFGGRLLEAGRDVTFLVRPARAEALRRTGLVIRSPLGDCSIPSPPLVVASDLRGPFDLILLSCKAYDLESAITSLAPAVGSGTAILPLLNGMGHLDRLAERFGREAVLGGQCVISADLDSAGTIVHLNDLHLLSFGELAGGVSSRVRTIAAAMAGARFEGRASENIVQEMWEKWIFIAAFAGITCLMRAPIGDIVSAGGADLASTLLDECTAIALAAGQGPRTDFLSRAKGMLTAEGSPIAASMLRDIERGAPIEAAQILGDLLARRPPVAGPDRSLLRIAATHLRAYEARRAVRGSSL